MKNGRSADAEWGLKCPEKWAECREGKEKNNQILFEKMMQNRRQSDILSIERISLKERFV